MQELCWDGGEPDDGAGQQPVWHQPWHHTHPGLKGIKQRVSAFRIRFNLIRIRHFRLNIDPDPIRIRIPNTDPDSNPLTWLSPDPIRIWMRNTGSFTYLSHVPNAERSRIPYFLPLVVFWFPHNTSCELNLFFNQRHFKLRRTSWYTVEGTVKRP